METSSTIPVEIQSDQLDPSQDFTNYNAIKPRLVRLIDKFSAEQQVTITRREVRYIDVSVKEKRNSGELDETDTFVPIRVCDTNIRREQPPFVAYLKQSKRLCSFIDVAEPSTNTTDIENEFTRVNTYIKWEIPHFKCLDGSQTHGWAFIEVVYDETKPGHVGLDYIAHDDLIFPIDSENIESCEIILRRFSVSILKLKEFVRDFGFNPEQVRLLTESKKDLQADENIIIHKCFYKQNGVVYVGWLSKDICTDWLKSPGELFLGVATNLSAGQFSQDPLSGQQIPLPPQWQDSTESTYPIFRLPYFETEQKKLVDYKGRVYMDKHKQEAMTSGWSAFLSAQNNAASVYASTDRESTGGQAKVQSIKLKHKALVDEKINFFHTPYPDPSMLAALQALDIQNSAETGQTAFAVKNRKDSRKTATEVQASKEDTALLSSVQVTLYSTFVREVYSLVWRIVQSQALQDKIVFLYNKELGQNNYKIISKVYELHAAGDTDVIRRAELLEEYQNLLPLVVNTPIYLDILSEIVRLTLSEKGTILSEKLKAGDPSHIIASLLSVLQGAISPEEQQMLAPDEINSLKGIITEGVSYLQQVGYQPPQQNGNKNESGTTGTSGANGKNNQHKQT